MSQDQEQPNPQEQLNKRKAFVPKLMELSVLAPENEWSRYCSELALSPSRYGQPPEVYAVVSKTANQSKSVKL